MMERDPEASYCPLRKSSRGGLFSIIYLAITPVLLAMSCLGPAFGGSGQCDYSVYFIGRLV